MAFKTGQTSVQKGKITSYERVGEGTKGDRITITYTRTDEGGDATKQVTANKLYSSFSTTEKELLKEAATTKGELTLTKTFTQTPGEEEGKGFWNLTGIGPASDFVPKPPTTNKFNKGGYTGAKSSNIYDSAGAKAGGVLHDAVAVSIAQKGKDTTTAHIATVARELLSLSTQLENEARASKDNKSTTKETTPVAESLPNHCRTTNAVSTSTTDFDSLDDIEVEL